MLGALILLPALAHFLLPQQSQVVSEIPREQQPEEKKKPTFVTNPGSCPPLQDSARAISL
jgi:hypothetical protein